MYKVGDKAFMEVDIVLDGDEKSYCFPNTKSKVYECRVKGLTHEDNKLMYFSEKQLVSSPIAKIRARLNEYQFVKYETGNKTSFDNLQRRIEELEWVMSLFGEE